MYRQKSFCDFFLWQSFNVMILCLHWEVSTLICIKSKVKIRVLKVDYIQQTKIMDGSMVFILDTCSKIIQFCKLSHMVYFFLSNNVGIHIVLYYFIILSFNWFPDFNTLSYIQGVMSKQTVQMVRMKSNVVRHQIA
jgi:hypothetical protein